MRRLKRRAGIEKPLSQGRELKLDAIYDKIVEGMEAPLAGAWIEIDLWGDAYERNIEAPLAGAWIEIGMG